MKAVINGVEVFGTPEEVIQYKQLSDQMLVAKSNIYITNIHIENSKDIDKIIENSWKLAKGKLNKIDSIV